MKKKICLMLAVMLLLLSACSRTTAPKPTMAQYFAPSKRIPVETTAEPTQPETAAPDQTAVDSPERAALCQLASRLSRLGGQHRRFFSPKYVDLDGDGGGGNAHLGTRYGFLYEIVVQADGRRSAYTAAAAIRRMTPPWDFYLCEGNLLEKGLRRFAGRPAERILPGAGQAAYDGGDRHGERGREILLSESGGASGLMWTEITEAEYNRIRESYVRVGVPQNPSRRTSRASGRRKKAFFWK